MTTETTDYLTIRQAAARIGCSVRHLERVVSSNDPELIGLTRWGERSSASTSRRLRRRRRRGSCDREDGSRI